MRKIILWAALACLVGGVPAAVAGDRTVADRLGLAPRDTLPDEPRLEDYLGYALWHNGDIAAATARHQAARDQSEATGALPDPRLTWSEALEPVETRVGPQERILALTQQLPWFGTLGLQRAVESERADAAAARADAVTLRVLREVRTAYHELVYLEQTLDVAAGHLELLVQYEAVARARYETGSGTYADVVKAQVEMARLENRLAGLRDRRRPLRARFNAAAGRAADAPVRLVDVESGHMNPADPETAVDPHALGAAMLAANPELAVISHEAASQLRSGELAGKRRYPGLSLGINWIQIGEARSAGTAGSGKDAAFATLGVSLPLWRGSYNAAERAADGRFRAAEHQRSDLSRRLAVRLEQAVYDHRDAARRRALYRDTLLPKAGQSLAASRAAYEAGSAGFLELVDAQRVLLEFELAARRATADLLISRADLESMVAGPLGGLDDRKED